MTESAYSQWRSAPFPRSSRDDTLDRLNKELAYWDAMAAGTIIPVMDSGVAYDSGVLDLTQGLAGLREELVAVARRADPGEADLVGEHITYTDLLAAANAEASASG